jgi:predicted nucleic acid-binding protein
MKVLLDTNVILDLLLDREPFADDAAQLISMVERCDIEGFLGATTITTIHYLLTKELGAKKAIQHIRVLLSLFEIASVHRVVIEGALDFKSIDFEDAVLDEAAFHAGVQYIVTRDVSGFKTSRLPVYSPNEFISMLASLKGV